MFSMFELYTMDELAHELSGVLYISTSGLAPLAWYESRGIGRCFSFLVELPVTESCPR